MSIYPEQVLGNVGPFVHLPLVVKIVTLLLTMLPGELVPPTKQLSVLPLNGQALVYLPLAVGLGAQLSSLSSLEEPQF